MKLFTIVFLLLPIAGFQASASSIDVVTCKGVVQNLDRNYLKEVNLRAQSYDPEYYEGKIGAYTFAGVTHDFSIGQAILLIADPAVKRTAMLTASLTHIAGTNVKYAAQQYVIDETDGTQTWLSTTCYLAPPGEVFDVNAHHAKYVNDSALALKRRQ